MDDDDDPSQLLPRIGVTGVLYLAFAVLPAMMLAGGALWWAVERASLPAGQHFTPWVDRVGWAAGIGVLLTAVVSLLPALVLGVRRIPGQGWRVGIGVGLLAVHLMVVSATTLTAFGAVLPDLLDQETLTGKANEPGGRPRKALLYRDKGECTWTIYLAEPLDPVATSAQQVKCRCDNMPEADVRWVGSTPELIDPTGRPYHCPPPPSGCDSGATPAGWLVIVLASVIARRRRTCAR
jgi:hypothetical protein